MKIQMHKVITKLYICYFKDTYLELQFPLQTTMSWNLIHLNVKYQRYL